MSDQFGAPHWDLSQLYRHGSPELEADIRRIREMGESISRWKGALDGPGFGAGEFRGLIAALEEAESLASRVSGYADLYFSEDTSNQRAQSLKGRVDQELVGLENSALFFWLWWKDLDGERAGALMGAVPGVRYHLERVRANKPYTLTEPEERIINHKNVTGSQALVLLYDAITNRYRFGTGFLRDGRGGGGGGDGPGAPGGSPGGVPREELMVHVRSPLPAVREGAYREFFRVYEGEGPTLALIFQSLARDWATENVALRGHADPRAVRDRANDLPGEVVGSLLRVCREEAPRVFGRYFRLKAKALGMERLRRYDVYAPVAPSQEEGIPFGEALAEVREAFRGFSPEFAGAALRVHSERRLSAARIPGKESGAFCASLGPRETPWVLMTYKGKTQDAFTLAHELGHAAHSQLAAGEGPFQFHAALPLAETASTFGEMLLAGRLRKGALGGAARRALMFRLLDDAYATVGRQAFFSLFESEAHRMAGEGATAAELSGAYLRNLRGQFGGSVEVGPEFAWEWVSIPHFFHTPFYVYAYSFGQLLVYSLYRRYELEGPSFAQAILGILARGGGAAPASILSGAGVGPLDDSFWRGGFEVIEGFMEGLG